MATKRSPLKSRFFYSKRPHFTSSLNKNRTRWHITKKSKKVIRKLALIIIITFSTIILITISTLFILLAMYLGEIKASLPDPGQLADRQLEQSTRIYDRNGTLLYTVYDEYNRHFVSIDQIPEHTKWAVLAAEDIEFYNHRGVDFVSLAVIFFEALTTNRIRGASTIDQQLVRNTILYDMMGEDAYKKDPMRKFKEMLIAMELNKKLTKDQILELYMNDIPLGGPNYGFQAAAQAYFSKDVQDLTVAESAFLAGIIKAPSSYSPLAGGDPKVGQARRDEILDLMDKYQDRVQITTKKSVKIKKKKTKTVREIRPISTQDVKEAKDSKLNFKYKKVKIKAPHFVFYVIKQLDKKYGKEAVRNGGLQVKTSLDLKMQTVGENIVKRRISTYKTWYGTHNGALVAINPNNGHILAMVGSVGYNKKKDKRVDGKVNVTLMPRQMGSSVKPYVYINAFQNGYTPYTSVPDKKKCFGTYCPLDWDKRFMGNMSVRSALNLSRNLPAIYTLDKTGGTDAFIRTVEKVGMTTLKKRNRFGLSVAIGAAEMRLLEHTNGYAAFANEGVQYPATSILEITDPTGETLYKYDPQKSKKRVFGAEETYMLNWILCQMGGRKDKLSAYMYQTHNQPLCGKTGTNDGPKDLTTFLYYPKLVVGVWTGNNNGALTFGTMGQGWSTNVPITIAREYVDKVYKRFGYAWYSPPNGMQYKYPL